MKKMACQDEICGRSSCIDEFCGVPFVKIRNHYLFLGSNSVRGVFFYRGKRLVLFLVIVRVFLVGK